MLKKCLNKIVAVSAFMVVSLFAFGQATAAEIKWKMATSWGRLCLGGLHLLKQRAWGKTQGETNDWFKKAYESQLAYETLWKDASRYRNVATAN